MEALIIFKNCVVALFIFLFIKYLWKRRQIYLFSMRLKGPLSIPFIGTISIAIQLMTTKDSMKVILENYKKYSGIFRIWILQDLFIPVFEPEDVKEVLYNSDAKPPMVTVPWGESMGYGLLAMSNCDKNTLWKSHRNLLNQSLTPSCVKHYYPKMQEICAMIVDDVEKICNKGLVDIGIVLMRSCADIVTQTLQNTKLEFRNGEKDHIIEAVEAIGLNIYDRVVIPWYWYEMTFKFTKAYEIQQNAYKHVDDFAKEVYAIRMQDCLGEKTDNIDGLSSFDVLFKAQMENKITERDVLNEIIHIWIAAYDTIGNSLSHLALSFAMNKNCQDKAYQEIKDFFENKDTIEWDDLDKFTYMDMCMKESLRLFPIGPSYFRYATKDIQLKSKKLIIPRGTTIGIVGYITMRDGKYWEDPLTFNPERFSTEEVAKRHPFSYIPFGAGLRKCIGMHYGKVLFKLQIIYLLKHFELHSDWKIEELPLRFDFDTRLLWGHRVKVTHRTGAEKLSE